MSSSIEYVSGTTSVAGLLDVPSGQPLELHEVLVDNVGPEAWLRFRFLANTIGKTAGAKTFVDVEPDFIHLCETVARPYMNDFNLAADVVAISMMSQPVAFGVSDPNVTQFVEVFRVSSGACEWEGL